jgi:hypothetical protein
VRERLHANLLDPAWLREALSPEQFIIRGFTIFRAVEVTAPCAALAPALPRLGWWHHRAGTGQRLAPVHPGDVLLHDFIEPMGLTRYRVAKSINVPQRRIDEIWGWVPDEGGASYFARIANC